MYVGGVGVGGEVCKRIISKNTHIGKTPLNLLCTLVLGGGWVHGWVGDAVKCLSP